MLEPTVLPPTVTRLPLARSGKRICAMPVMAAGYSRPVSIVNKSVKRNPGPNSLIISFTSCETEHSDQFVDRPDAGKRHDDAANSIEEEIAAEYLARADRP